MTAAELEAVVRGMELPEGLTFRPHHPSGDLYCVMSHTVVATHLAELALEGHFARKLDDESPDWTPRKVRTGLYSLRAKGGHRLATGPTKLHAMVAALKALEKH